MSEVALVSLRLAWQRAAEEQRHRLDDVLRGPWARSSCSTCLRNLSVYSHGARREDSLITELANVAIVELVPESNSQPIVDGFETVTDSSPSVLELRSTDKCSTVYKYPCRGGGITPPPPLPSLRYVRDTPPSGRVSDS